MQLLFRRPGEFWGRADTVVQIMDCEVRRMHATAPEQDVLEHTHEAPHFVFVPGGGYISSAVGAPDLSRLPLLVFNPAGTRHRDRFLHGCGAFVTVTVGPALADMLPEGLPTAIRDIAAIGMARRLERLLQDGGRTMEYEGLVWGLLAAASALPHDCAAPRWLQGAFEAIWEARDPALSVASVARDVGVHPVHLARVFSAHLGCAPAEALRARRLERAASMLGWSRAGLAAVAADLGYADQSHLTRSFRDGFGMTPRSFRRSRDVAPIQESDPLDC